MGYTTEHRSRIPKVGVPDTGKLLNSTMYLNQPEQRGHWEKFSTCRLEIQNEKQDGNRKLEHV